MQKLKNFLSSRALVALCLLSLSFGAQALEKTNRLGLGVSNELKNDIPALSFKIQKSKSFAYGGLIGFSSSQNDGGLGVGIKLYRNIFDEPQLNFYLAGMGALISTKEDAKTYSGFQFDLSLGSEFHFTGLNSLGFSFEFGVSANKKKDFVFETIGSHFLVVGIHFYL
ncbi:MAG: hypothetical protein H7177_04735 [Rhizobacter sp.]|nr:hypothetical protein [Bacteriovorax sp.]